MQTESPHLKRVLGVPSLVLFGLVYMVPLTVFTTYGIVTQVSGGRLPLAYIVTLAAMTFTAISYARMTRAYPFAGSAYTYTQRTFGPEAGFLAGWSLMLDYLFLPLVNYLVIGLYLAETVPAVPSWVWAILAIGIVTVLNLIGIVQVARANAVIITLQTIFIVVFLALVIAQLAGRGNVDFAAPFLGDSSAGGIGPVFAGAAILALSFLGFDAVSTLAEEAKRPKHDIPLAIVIVTLLAGGVFILLAYAGHLVYPSHEFTDPDTGSFDVVRAAGGQWLAILFTAAYVTGALGSALTSQASVARILFAMGRDGVIPRVFGTLWPKFATPAAAILAVTVLSLGGLFISLDILVGMVSFGALVAFSAVNLSVIKHYVIDKRSRSVRSLLRYLLPALIGFGLTGWLWTSLQPQALLVGLVWLGFGAAWLAVLTRGFRKRAPMLDITEKP